MRKFKKLLFQGNCKEDCTEGLILYSQGLCTRLLKEFQLKEKMNKEKIEDILDELEFTRKRIAKSTSYEGSENKILLLKEIFTNALSLSAVLQQIGHFATSKQAAQAKKQEKQLKKELEDSLKDIVMALTGKEIN